MHLSEVARKTPLSPADVGPRGGQSRQLKPSWWTAKNAIGGDEGRAEGLGQKACCTITDFSVRCDSGPKRHKVQIAT
jgi:hypothetical protein